MRVVILGLSITSSWGNGHATNYRALLRSLTERGHDVLFLERDVPWYAEHRDLPSPPHGRTELYSSRRDLEERFAGDVTDADLVVVGSYVPEGRGVGGWVTDTATRVTAFYDIDTPVTLAALARNDCEYLSAELVAAYDLYLSFTAGPTLTVLEQDFGARRACAFYCMVDADEYQPRDAALRWDLGYLGTYSDDRQPVLDALLLEPARRRPDLRFVVAGPQYPDSIAWPQNVDRIEHLPPTQHVDFYAAQRMTLNVTRADMKRAGWSPSVRLFEAAACAVPVVSDDWRGLDEIFSPDSEIVIAQSAEDVIDAMDTMTAQRRQAIGTAARARVLAHHTALRRAQELEQLVRDVSSARERR
jgi:spore maturation protein CgeB